MPSARASTASAALAAALAAVAFGASGGTQLGRTTIVELAIIIAAGLALGVAVLYRDRPLYGGTALASFALLAIVTGLSMSWSIAPDLTLQEGGRTLAYLAVFAAAAALAGLVTDSSGTVLAGFLMAGVAVCGWALVTRVWPGALAEEVLGARLAAPFDYWNALGSTAALTMPAALWLGSRRHGHPIATALAYPALGVLMLTLVLTQSRGALAAAIVAAVLWLALVPLRLRSIVVLALPALAVLPIAAWALSKAAFTESFQPLSAREAVAGDFGLMLLLLCTGLLAAGLAVAVLSRRRPPSLQARWRFGLAVAVVACALPLAGVASVAASDRGLAGTVSDRLDEVTNETAAPPRGSARLGSVASSRAEYWHQARQIFDERPVVGQGANSFALARLPYRKSNSRVGHAHSYMMQTLADMGLVGGAVALALLAAWLVAAGRATALLPRRRPAPEWEGERAALAALSLCAVAYGLQSAIDWTWFIPGPTVAALAAAGYVAGRGPLSRPGERSLPAGPAARGRLGGLLPAVRPGPARLAGAAAVMITALLCAWTVWQPERAARANDRSFDLLQQNRLPEALREAKRAREIDPYSAEPLYRQAAVLSAERRYSAAYRTMERAVIEHPRDPNSWLALARFELDTLDLPARALDTLGGAFRVDPRSQLAAALADRARAAAGSPPPVE